MTETLLAVLFVSLSLVLVSYITFGSIIWSIQ